MYICINIYYDNIQREYTVCMYIRTGAVVEVNRVHNTRDLTLRIKRKLQNDNNNNKASSFVCIII